VNAYRSIVFTCHFLNEKFPEMKVIAPKPPSDVEDNSKRLGGQSTDGLNKDRLGKINLNKKYFFQKKKNPEKTTSLPLNSVTGKIEFGAWR
jgi:hypothetical protein